MSTIYLWLDTTNVFYLIFLCLYFYIVDKNYNFTQSNKRFSYFSGNQTDLFLFALFNTDMRAHTDRKIQLINPLLYNG